MDTLSTYQVSLHEEHLDGVELLFQCWAEDCDHAVEQAENAYPNCEVVHVMPIPVWDYL